MNELEQLKRRVAVLEGILHQIIFSDRYLFNKKLQLPDGINLQCGISTGTKIGTGTTQKIGFFNATPVVQQAAVPAPSGGATIDAEARAAITSLITEVQNLGLTA